MSTFRHLASATLAVLCVAATSVASAQPAGSVTTPTTEAQPASTSTLASGVHKLADIPYGSAPRQKVDVYLPPVGSALPGGAPILVMVHGGAWMFGDKKAANVVDGKVAHWAVNGWIFVSVNNRLSPQADPVTQASDVAAAIGLVQHQASGWGGDAKRLVLMGHSAGAHLVALLAASPSLARQGGAAPWAGTIVLDSAAIDLSPLMQRRHAGFYDRVFGADPAVWRAASPTDRLEPGGAPMLLICSTQRSDDSCGQSQRFADRATALGLSARVHGEALSHGEINATLGRPGEYTDTVDSFIATLPAFRH